MCRAPALTACYNEGITNHKFALHLIRDSTVIPNYRPHSEHPQETTTSRLGTSGLRPDTSALRAGCCVQGTLVPAFTGTPFVGLVNGFASPIFAPDGACLLSLGSQQVHKSCGNLLMHVAQVAKATLAALPVRLPCAFSCL